MKLEVGKLYRSKKGFDCVTRFLGYDSTLLIGKVFRVTQVYPRYTVDYPTKTILDLIHIEIIDDKINTVSCYIPQTGIKDIFTLLSTEEAEKINQEFFSTIKTSTTISSLPVKGGGLYLGSDPECFALRADGEVLPAWEYLPKKSSPLEIADGGTAYIDGFQGEWTVKPQTCIAYLTDRVRRGLEALDKRVKEVSPGGKLTARPVVEISPSVLAAAPQEWVEFGCMPSMNAYEDTSAMPEVDPRSIRERFAGFHMHFNVKALNGGPKPHAWVEKFVKTTDALSGVVMTCVLHGLEDERRRLWYGRAGEYRTPPHGVEYRVLSSAVLWHPVLVHLAFNLARAAQQLVERGWEVIWEAPSDSVRGAINNLDIRKARKIVRENSAVLEKMLRGIYPTMGETEVKKLIDGLILTGVKESVELDIYNNWSLRPGSWLSHSNNSEATVAKFVERL